MVKITGSVIVNVNIETVYDLTLHYFTSLGFTLVSGLKPTQMILERGSVWWADNNWRSKKCNVVINLSKTQDNNTLILCDYDIHWAVYSGEEDTQEACREIEGLKNFIASLPSEQKAPAKDRMCVMCKRKIPWDANLCPYCGHDYRKKGENNQ